MIVAATDSNGIGKYGGLPWRLKKDMDHFRKMTTNLNRETGGKQNVCIMGRVTWESIPKNFKPLKDRINIIISRTLHRNEIEGVKYCSSLDEAIEYARSIDPPSIWVIGGAQIYELAEPYCDQIFITRIHSQIDCDAHFKVKFDHFIQLDKCQIQSEIPGFDCSEQEEQGLMFKFQVWNRAK